MEYYQVQHKQEEQIRPSRKARDKRTPTMKPKFNINQMNNNPHYKLHVIYCTQIKVITPYMLLLTMEVTITLP